MGRKLFLTGSPSSPSPSRNPSPCLVAFWLIPADWIPRSFSVGCRTKATTCTAVYVDLGQPCEDREAILQKARDNGAKSARIVDAREELCRDFAFPVLQWQAKYEGVYLLGTSIARPLISKVCLQVAREVGAEAYRPRRHRQGERPVPLPAGGRGARARREDHRPLADRRSSASSFPAAPR